MRSRPLTVASLALTLALFAACSKQNGSGQSGDLHEAPDVSPTAAPGVAWRYAYEFQLPDDAIEAVQEAHASECEALGVSRCRITGLRYSVSNDNAVSAMLEVKLAPELARQFGKQATGNVRKAGGRLSNTEFSGEDVGPVLSEAARNKSDAQTQVSDIQKQLANRSLKDAERAQLQSQLDQLRSQASVNQAGSDAAQERLASTPMTFNYYGKGGNTGFAGRNPLMDAVRSFVGSLVTMISFVLQAMAVLLPWLLLLGLVILIARSRPGHALARFVAPRRDHEDQES